MFAGEESELKEHDIDKDLSVYLHDEATFIANQVAAAEVVVYDPKAPPGTKLDSKGIQKLKWENYWKSFTTVINSKTLRIWQHLEQGLIAYNKLLKDRYNHSTPSSIIHTIILSYNSNTWCKRHYQPFSL